MTFKGKKYKSGGFPQKQRVINNGFFGWQGSNFSPTVLSLLFSVITLTFFVFGSINGIFIRIYNHLTTRPLKFYGYNE